MQNILKGAVSVVTNIWKLLIVLRNWNNILRYVKFYSDCCHNMAENNINIKKNVVQDTAYSFMYKMTDTHLPKRVMGQKNSPLSQ